MDFTSTEINTLFEIAKHPCDLATIEFPLQGEYIEIILQNVTGKIKFQSDVSRSNTISNKLTLQLRHKKIYSIRRLDFLGSHKNPPGPAPDEIFVGFEDYLFLREDHVHFYTEGYGERWALPLAKVSEIGILPTDNLYEKMIKFFQYCNVNDLKILSAGTVDYTGGESYMPSTKPEAHRLKTCG